MKGLLKVNVIYQKAVRNTKKAGKPFENIEVVHGTEDDIIGYS